MRTRSRIQLAGLSSPQHILINFSSPILRIGVNGVMLPLAILTAYNLNGSLPFVGLLAGVLVATALTIYRPPNPFFIGQLWGKRVTLGQLDEPSLCVLTFLKSGQARRIVVSIAAVLTLIIAVAWFASNFLLERLEVPDPESLWTGSFGSCIFLAFVAFGNYTGLLFRYALKHWEEIQRTYKPWPVTEVFELPLKQIFKREAWRRSEQQIWQRKKN